jgi:hypothetical protein
MLGGLLIIAAASAGAGAGMGRVVSRRARMLMFIGGIEAGLIALALRWLAARPGDPVIAPSAAEVLTPVLLGIAAVAVPFALGAWWARP